MNNANLQYCLDAAADQRHSDPFAVAVRSSIEVGAIVPSQLRSEMKKAKLRVVDDQASMAEYGFKSTKMLKRVLVFEGKELIAMGAAADKDEALLAAVLGWFREHPLDKTPPAGIAVRTN